MPMSKGFEKRLYPILPEIVKEFGTPFHIYDEAGIIENGKDLIATFAKFLGFQEFFAVKACPNLTILKIMSDLGFGFDCSSLPELVMCWSADIPSEKVMFTSNNTSRRELEVLSMDKSILNLDDLTMISKVKTFPELICFRYNPGEEREGNHIIGQPALAKYGIRDDQIVAAYQLAKNRGAKRFGLHTMICSNELNYGYMVETVKMLLDVIKKVNKELGITFEFINIGGGIGIPYQPGQAKFNLPGLAQEAADLFRSFRAEFGYVPKLYMECGRYMTGPYGVLVSSVINRMSKHREYVGLDACMSDLMRPALYNAYHHITVLGGEDRKIEVVDVVGSLCENNDKFAQQRTLPRTKEGDIVIIHDTGAHGYAMGFNYNGRLRSQELLFCEDGTVKLIRRAETTEDYLATFNYKRKILVPKK